MRGEERQQRSMLMELNLEQRVPKDHPLRRVRHGGARILGPPTFPATADRLEQVAAAPALPRPCAAFGLHRRC